MPEEKVYSAEELEQMALKGLTQVQQMFKDLYARVMALEGKKASVKKEPKAVPDEEE